MTINYNLLFNGPLVNTRFHFSRDADSLLIPRCRTAQISPRHTLPCPSRYSSDAVRSTCASADLQHASSTLREEAISMTRVRCKKRKTWIRPVTSMDNQYIKNYLAHTLSRAADPNRTILSKNSGENGKEMADFCTDSTLFSVNGYPNTNVGQR